MRPHLPSRLLLALLLTAGAPVFAASDEVADLLRNARAWDARQRPDMVRSVLHKALLIEPDSAASLLLLGDAEARAGNTAAAEDALRRLERIGPSLPATRQLRDVLRVTTRDKADLAKARLLSRAGQADEAMVLWRKLLPDGPPPGALAIEYYQNLGGAEKGFEPAQAALQRLAQATGEWRYTLARLTLLGARQPTRQEAARGIAQLSKRPDVDRKQLVDEWTFVLNRLSDSPETIPFLEPYVAFAPEDSVAAERLAMLRGSAGKARAQAATAVAPPAPVAPIDPTLREVDAGLDALARGDLAEAERLLTGVLKKRPRDPDVLGGIGRLLMRQGRNEEAQKWLAQAATHDPANRQRWLNLAQSAKVDGLMRQADSLDDQGKPADAERVLRSVLAMQPDLVDAIALLGSVRQKQGDNVEAERLLRDALRREPGNGTATRALVRVLLAQNRRDDVMTVIADDKEGRFAYVQAGLLRDEADKLAEAGKRIEATDVLHKALALQPADPWIRFSLARLYVAMRMVRMANQVMGEGMQLAPQDPSMAYATALYLNGQDNPQEALKLLLGIRPQDRSEGMRELYKRASIAQARRQAAAHYAQGRREQGDAVLMEAEKLADGSPDDARAMAEMWFSANQPERGLAWMRSAAEKPGATGETRLYYAGLLNRAKRDDALATWLPELENSAGWTTAQIDTLFGIRLDMAERRIVALASQGQFEQAREVAAAGVPTVATPAADGAAATGGAPDASVLPAGGLPAAGLPATASPAAAKAKARLLSEAGDAAGAVAALRPVVAQDPADVTARMELARNLALTGQNEAARRETREVVSRAAPDDIDNRLSAARLYVRINQFAAARDVMTGLMRVAPNDPSVVVQAGRVERADKRYSLAMRYFEHARELERVAALGAAPSGEEFATIVSVAPAEPSAEEALVETAAAAPAPTPKTAAPVAPPTVEPDPAPRVPPAATTPAASPDFLAALPAPAPVAVEPSSAQREMDSIEARRMPRIETAVSLLSKNSSPGLSTLRGYEVPVIGYLPIGYDGHAFAQVDRVSLDAGNLPASFDDAALFGKVQAFGNALPSSLSQRATGTSAAVGYVGDDVRADIGVTGMGFPVTNVVGGVARTGEFSLGGDRNYRYAVEGSRRPMTSTLLSYAGTRDAITGQTWGGVVMTGGSGRVSTDLGPYSVSGTAGYSWLTGRNVQTNRRLALRASIDQDVYKRPGMTVNAGLALTHWRYAENQNYLTFGHGGYYSPQRYTAVGLPVEVYGRSDRLTYLARGSVSVSRTRQSAAPFYPTSDLLQAQAAAAPLPSGYSSPLYDGSTGSGVGYSLRLAAEYRLTPRFVLGGTLNIDRSSYYNPVNMFLYARYFLEGSRPPNDDSPTPVRPYSQY